MCYFFLIIIMFSPSKPSEQYQLTSTRIQDYKITRIQEYKNTRIQEYKNTRIQEYKITRLQLEREFLNFRIIIS